MYSNLNAECYGHLPAAVEVFSVDGKTDIILRKNIREVTKQEPESGEEYTAWECEERQLRYAGEVSEEDVTASFSAWWATAGTNETPDMEARLSALEAAMVETAKEVYGG